MDERTRKVLHLIVCHRCLHKRVVDWTVLGLASGACELCGAAADFEIDFAIVRRLKRGVA
jgi:hypothetical protein